MIEERQQNNKRDKTLSGSFPTKVSSSVMHITRFLVSTYEPNTYENTEKITPDRHARLVRPRRSLKISGLRIIDALMQVTFKRGRH